jgi:DNA mismatch repair ATPase MutS
MKVANKNTTSLMIMDEIGQGTSTSDGYAIASAVARALMKSNTAITLFTTHFHDLHESLASSSALRFASCHMSSEINEKTGDVVRYNYKLCDGAAPFGSCGLTVARLAGLDDSILQKSKRVAHLLQTTKRAVNKTKRTKDDILSSEALSALKQLLRDPKVNDGHIANEREWCIEFYQYWKYVERLLAH